jgi:hypothetical protein
MTIPYITPKQQEIPKLIYKFRFLNRLQIQILLNHKYHNRIIDWLNDLSEKEYLEKVPKSNTFEQKTKLTIYRIGINGIRFLNIQDDCSKEIIKNLYKDKNRSDDFIDQCIFLCDIYLSLIKKDVNNDKVTYEVITNSDFVNSNSYFHFLKELSPDLIYKETKKTKNRSSHTYNLLTVFETTLPRYSVRKRLRNYFEFYQSSEWENETGKTFPIILFICSTKSELIYAKRYTKKLLQDYQNPTDLHIQFATVDKVKEFGISGEIWEEVEQKLPLYL